MQSAISASEVMGKTLQINIVLNLFVLFLLLKSYQTMAGGGVLAIWNDGYDGIFDFDTHRYRNIYCRRTPTQPLRNIFQNLTHLGTLF